ncbi:peptide ABC transporter substrate-binding protein [Marinilactibacillus sp. 15R]|uniref:Oligopeptide transport system substrate-binding protein n=1 Tax=Marinilactibacillus piezotolerans TaxID=258723 RepID=A0A1I3VHU0_9LACT|nr:MULTISPECIES: peptide ABC transporter substrate-binding protein [Marinilactibacillus]API88537.1 peptide ABC transporter substrate-binding protein [Marinilactibacillus sp. 15R]SFJ94553.1 oligopeptide transport system substrate-binding protein [Marinilactibacillus piezotolerans]
MRIHYKSLVSMSAVFLLSACGGNDESANSSNSDSEGDTPSEQVVHYTAPTELSTMDTVMITDINSSNYLGQVVEGLLKIDEEGDPVPAIAADEGTVSEDGLTYTYTLRDDVVWSNGDPVTANDFVFAMQKLVNPETGASYSYLAETIENAPEIMAGEKDVSELGVTANGDHEITFKLTQPTPYFKYLLAFTAFFPQNQTFVEEQGDRYGTSSDTVLANGPFTLENWDGTGLTWDLEKNEDYYAADEIMLDTINVQVIKETSTAVNLFEAGEVDNAQLTGDIVQQYADDENVVVQKKARTSYLEFNWDNEYLQNDKLREAIGLVINTDDLVNTLLGDGSTEIGGFLPADFVTNPSTGEDFSEEAGSFLSYDPERAKELWEEAKSELGVDSISLSFLGDDDEKSKKLSQYIQGQIQNNLSGVSVELRNVPKKNRLEISDNGDFDLLLTGWGADFSDAINFMDLKYSDSPYNRGRYANSEFDALIDKAKTTDANDEDKRWEDLQQAHQILTDDFAFVPLYQEAETQLRNPAVEGIIFNSVGVEFDLSRASIKD